MKQLSHSYTVQMHDNVTYIGAAQFTTFKQPGQPMVIWRYREEKRTALASMMAVYSRPAFTLSVQHKHNACWTNQKGWVAYWEWQS